MGWRFWGTARFQSGRETVFFYLFYSGLAVVKNKLVKQYLYTLYIKIRAKQMWLHDQDWKTFLNVQLLRITIFTTAPRCSCAAFCPGLPRP